MAVLNMPRTGIDRCSTRMPESDIDNYLAAGFDGYITDDIWGTSFSAPRIAWFLAAGEAVRTKPFVDLGDWSADLPGVLRKLRDPAATGYEKLRFNPVRYIQEQSGLAVVSKRYPESLVARDTCSRTRSSAR